MQNPNLQILQICTADGFGFRRSDFGFGCGFAALPRACPRTWHLGNFVEELCRRTLSKNFVEIGHFQRNSDKVFRQRWTTKLGVSLLGQALLSRIHAVETNPHPDPLPFTKGEGNLRGHRVRVTEQESKTGAFLLSSPRSERGEDQGEGRFRLHTYGLG